MLRQNTEKKHYCVLTFNSAPSQNCSALKTANETMRGHCITRGHSCTVSGGNKLDITQSDTGSVENKKWLKQRLEGA